mgnify:CR=1 FL=1
MMTWVVGFSVKLKWTREASTRVRKLVKPTRVDQVHILQTDRALSRHRYLEFLPVFALSTLLAGLGKVHGNVARPLVLNFWRQSRM